MSCQIAPSQQCVPSPQTIQKPQNSSYSKYARLAAGAVVTGGVVAGAMAIHSYMRTEMPIAPVNLFDEKGIINAVVSGGLAGSLSNSAVGAYMLYEDRHFNYSLNFKVNTLVLSAITGILPGVITGIIILAFRHFIPPPAEQK